jgi:hypothetical protein
MSALDGFASQVWLRVRQETGLRAAVWLGAVFLMLNLIFFVYDQTNAITPQIQQLLGQKQRLEQVLAEADWNEREEAARARLTAIENRFWSADSEGLVRAELQVSLEQIADRTNFEIVGIELRPMVAIDELPGWYRLGATVDASPDPSALVRYLGVLADADRQIIVDAVRFGRRNARSRLDVHAIVRIKGEDRA